MTKKKEMSQTQRLDYIRRQLEQSQEVTIRDLALFFGVSEMTVRRDLDLLESQGDVIRVHGGAAPAKRVTFEFRFRAEQQRNMEQKQAIALKALQHIKKGQSVIFDTGTTTLEIARLLPGKRQVKVITTSLSIVSELQFAADIELILLGGFLRDGSPDLHGPLTEQNLDMFQADIAFVGGDAVDKDGGIYTNDLRILSLDRKMASITKHLIVVADSSKFSRQAMCKVFKPQDYQTLISDYSLDQKLVRDMEKKGINIELAPVR